jgi:hypothetical protein
MIRNHTGPVPEPVPTSEPDLASVVVKTTTQALAFGVVPIWTVYERPKDCPNHYVARLHVSDRSGSRATTAAFKGDTLESVRDILITAGLSFIPRDESDDAVIVECWL